MAEDIVWVGSEAYENRMRAHGDNPPPTLEQRIEMLEYRVAELERQLGQLTAVWEALHRQSEQAGHGPRPGD